MHVNPPLAQTHLDKHNYEHIHSHTDCPFVRAGAIIANKYTLGAEETPGVLK